MPAILDDSVLLDRGAINFAFRVGQLLECLLVDRGIEHARESGSSMVTAEYVESCLNEDLFDELLSQVREISHDGTAGEGRIGNKESREAA